MLKAAVEDWHTLGLGQYGKVSRYEGGLPDAKEELEHLGKMSDVEFALNIQVGQLDNDTEKFSHKRVTGRTEQHGSWRSRRKCRQGDLVTLELNCKPSGEFVTGPRNRNAMGNEHRRSKGTEGATDIL